MNSNRNFDLKIYKRLQSLTKSNSRRDDENKINLVDHKLEKIEFKLPEGFKEKDDPLDFSYDKVNMRFTLESEEIFKKYTKDQQADPMNKMLKNYTIGENEEVKIITYRTISAVMNIFNFIFFKKVSDFSVFGIFTCPNSSSEKWTPVFEEVISSLKAVV